MLKHLGLKWTYIFVLQGHSQPLTVGMLDETACGIKLFSKSLLSHLCSFVQVQMVIIGRDDFCLPAATHHWKFLSGFFFPPLHPFLKGERIHTREGIAFNSKVLNISVPQLTCFKGEKTFLLQSCHPPIHGRTGRFSAVQN